MDSNTEKWCAEKILRATSLSDVHKIVIPPGEAAKKIETVCSIWEYLSNNGADRKSLMINLGGGMLTDLGGFAAATFKRGISFVNIPTTLLGAVDAAVGGKTGFNFCGLKNEIGVFAPAMAVFIDASFFRTLTHEELLSGYAEMIKHALLQSEEDLYEILRFDLESVDYDKLNDILLKSVLIKERIVEEDPTEKGIRKALNLGHTFGHAFESKSYELNRPIPHGYAVAWGIMSELFLSHSKLGFDKKILLQVVDFIKKHYGQFPIECKHYPELIELMKHDKKNEDNQINFTLLSGVGEIRINQTASLTEINEALDLFSIY